MKNEVCEIKKYSVANIQGLSGIGENILTNKNKFLSLIAIIYSGNEDIGGQV